MPKILFLFAACSFVLLLGCKESTIGPEIDPLLLQVCGNYEATTFIIPASNDGQLDLIKYGGMISVVLYPDFTTQGLIKMPRKTNTGIEVFNEPFYGRFTIKNDSLQFKDFENLLVHPQLFFIAKHNKLEGYLLGISPTIIILEKKYN